MITNNKTAIASKKNDSGILIYIPEKVKINNSLYVRKYIFTGTSGQTSPFIVTTGPAVIISVGLKHHTIEIASAFSRNLLLYYIDQANSILKKAKYACIKIGKAKRSDTWDPQFLSGMADITPQ